MLSDKELQGLQVPTLYIVGEHEKIYAPQKAIQRLGMVAPQIKTMMIPDAGHDLLALQTALINRTVLELLHNPQWCQNHTNENKIYLELMIGRGLPSGTTLIDIFIRHPHNRITLSM